MSTKKIVTRKSKLKKASKKGKPILSKGVLKGPAIPLSRSTPVKRVYAEPKFIPLLPGQLSSGDQNQYDAYAKLLQPIPPPRQGASLIMRLEDVIGQEAVNDIMKAGKIVFHAIGDTGADKQYRVADEADVAGFMAKDLSVNIQAERPSFFYHLGDVVYEFGQASSYYSQFYEPFCMYNAPIFAIPGNHDGMIWDKSMTTLEAFRNNFCTAQPIHSDNASSILRTTMNQPGVYFTLEAPYVNIIGLYSNVADNGAGVISTENNPEYEKIVSDVQKDFLISELKRLAPIRKKNQTAIIVAVHHPPYSGTSTQESTYGKDLDNAFQQGGIWPDLILSGHSHLYERYERNVNGLKIPYIVAGCGGYNLDPYAIASDPNAKVPSSLSGKDPALQAYIKAFGYMKVKATASQLAVIFNCIDPLYGPAVDSIVIDLKTHIVTEGKKGREPL
jgi:predicted phosphodiesterase